MNLRQIRDRIRENFVAHPLIWILCGLLAVVEYGNYERGKELDLLCDVTGPHDIYYGKPHTDGERAESICAARQSDDTNSRSPDQ